MLETERLTLRELTPADAEGLVALDADADVMKYVDTPSRVDRAGCLAAVERATGEFLGWVELTPDGWLGFRLNRKACGPNTLRVPSLAMSNTNCGELNGDTTVK